MKSTDLLVLAGAAGFAWWLLKGRTATAAPVVQTNKTGAAGTGSIFAKEILTQALPGQNGWGWKYYSDGTSIGPDGSYYKDGEVIWSPS